MNSVETRQTKLKWSMLDLKIEKVGFTKKIKRKVGFYFRAFLVYATVPTAAATNAAATMAAITDETSSTFGVGVTDADGSVTVLLVGIQIASIAIPLDLGVSESELVVYREAPFESCVTQHKNLKSPLVPDDCVMVEAVPMV
jgi:hypothetical protein